MYAQEPLGAEGVLGRLNAALSTAREPYASRFYSLDGYSKIMDGPWVMPTLVSPSGGVQRFKGYKTLHGDMAEMSMSDHDPYSHMAGAFSEALRHAIQSTEELGEKEAAVSLETQNTCSSNKWCTQFEQIAKLIKLDTTEFSTERAAFVAKASGYDTHKGVDISEQLSSLDDGLAFLAAELKAQGVWGKVAVVLVSEFGRSLITNTLGGTDHGWGGHYFIAGGAVRGGQILGDYPAKLADVDIGRGKMQPGRSWESLWHGIGDWWGLSQEELAEALPNAKRFPAGDLFTAEDLFG